MSKKKPTPETISIGPFDYIVVDGVMTEKSMYEAMNKKPKHKSCHGCWKWPTCDLNDDTGDYSCWESKPKKKVTEAEVPIVTSTACCNCKHYSMKVTDRYGADHKCAMRKGEYFCGSAYTCALFEENK